MSIRVEEDLSALRGGRAKIWIGQPLAEKDASFSIRRLHGEPEHLGRKGWQASPATLQPLSVETAGAECCLIVGPEVCNEIPDDALVEIAIPGAGVKEEIFWPYVTPSSRQETSALDRGRPRDAADPAQQLGSASSGTEETASLSSSEAEESGNPSGPEVTTPQPLSGTGETERPAAREADGDESKQTPDPRRPIVFAALCLAGLLGIVAAYFLLTQERGEQFPDYEQQVQDCVARNCPPEQFFELGVQLFESGNHDLGFRAIDRAAGDGFGPALEQIARWYDPRYFTSESGFSGADPAFAASYYERAEGAGVGRADQSIQEMCDYLAETDEAHLVEAPPCLR